MCTDSLGPGTGSGTTEPGEDHVAVLSVHGDLHGPRTFCGKLHCLDSSCLGYGVSPVIFAKSHFQSVIENVW